MPIEATIICVDNSEWTRNGDYHPSRFAAQSDAANLICGAKTQMHPENSVGILTMAGDRVAVRVTPTKDLGTVLNALYCVKIDGTCDFVRALQTAQLALKHRQNKNQRQRIVCFVGSPVEATEKELEVLAKSLKKNNVSIDVVSFGEVDTNTAKLSKFVQTANSKDTSHLVEIQPSSRMLSDQLLSSPVVAADADEESGGGGGGGGGGGAAPSGSAAPMNDFGVDPSSDPELYIALRISLEEERNRQQREQAEKKTEGGEGTAAGATAGESTGAEVAPTERSEAGASTSAAAPAAADQPSTGANAAGGQTPEVTADQINQMEDIDDELRAALLLSIQEATPAPPKPAEASPPRQPTAASAAATPVAAPAGHSAASGGGEGAERPQFQDPDYVQKMLHSLPGVDVNDPRIQEALATAGLRGAKGSEESAEGQSKEQEAKRQKKDEDPKKE